MGELTAVPQVFKGPTCNWREEGGKRKGMEEKG